MSKRRNGLLGVGGQRQSIPRNQLRGGRGSTGTSGNDPLAQKKELLRKMRERSEDRVNGEDLEERTTGEVSAGAPEGRVTAAEEE
ncbi:MULTISPECIES: DUF6243 family protein [Actinomadura]|uniref:DUF6243 family protein n=1 Tax=Actinomadura yumaensis TaxID=111807 RepID=A0ABW2CFY2_9ACTN|nr:DUF6243 family protein [Actinomadura sp. J1-007]MWK34857.1 hypothetical protein [Actinomadura sp. J1-007]